MQVLTTETLNHVITARPDISHKGTFGRVVLIGGNKQYGGAIMMAAESCVKSGAGLTTIVTAPENHTALHTRLPEAMVIDLADEQAIQSVCKQADVLLIGPGLGLGTHALTLLQKILQIQQAHQWLIIDGSAISLFSATPLRLPYPQHTVFTPHQMEWQRLSGLALPEQTTGANLAAVNKLQSIVVLKSHRTEIFVKDAHYQNPYGNPGMATGGMGDTLAGMVTAFLAQFDQNVETVCAAVMLHSLIGDALFKEHYVVLPTTISAQIPKYMKHFSLQGA